MKNKTETIIGLCTLVVILTLVFGGHYVFAATKKTTTNHAPTTPVLIGDENTGGGGSYGDVYANTEYVYSFTPSTDEDGDEINYFVYVDGKKVGEMNKDSEKSFKYTWAWNQAGSKKLQILARDDHNKDSELSNILSVDVYNISMSTDVTTSANNYEEFKDGEVGGMTEWTGKAQLLSECWEPGKSNYRIYLKPNINVKYFSKIKNLDTDDYLQSGSQIATGTKIRLEFVPEKSEHIFWFLTGGFNDSPYGSWVAGAGVPTNKTYAYMCKNYRPTNIDTLNAARATWGSASTPIYGQNTEVYLSYSVNPPAKSISYDSKELTCTDIVGSFDKECEVKATLKAKAVIDIKFVFDKTSGQMYANDLKMSEKRDKFSREWPAYTDSIDKQEIAFKLTVADSKNDAPDKPVINTNNIKINLDTEAQFTVIGTDKENDNIKYQVKFDSTSNEIAFESEFVKSGASYVFTKNWSKAGTKKVYVRSIDANSKDSSWVLLSVTVVSSGNKMQSPKIVPEDNCSLKEIRWAAINSKDPEYKMDYPGYTGAQAKEYRVYDTDKNIVSSCVVGRATYSCDEELYKFPESAQLKTGDKYYVSALDASGNESDLVEVDLDCPCDIDSGQDKCANVGCQNGEVALNETCCIDADNDGICDSIENGCTLDEISDGQGGCCIDVGNGTCEPEPDPEVTCVAPEEEIDGVCCVPDENGVCEPDPGPDVTCVAPEEEIDGVCCVPDENGVCEPGPDATCVLPEIEDVDNGGCCTPTPGTNVCPALVTCEAPEEEIDGICCTPDANGVCPRPMVCVSPEIDDGSGGCCLDEDSDLVCDKIENPEEIKCIGPTPYGYVLKNGVSGGSADSEVDINWTYKSSWNETDREEQCVWKCKESTTTVNYVKSGNSCMSNAAHQD